MYKGAVPYSSFSFKLAPLAINALTETISFFLTGTDCVSQKDHVAGVTYMLGFGSLKIAKKREANTPN